MAEDRSNHFSGNLAQKAIIEHNGSILVCRGIGDSVWELPGGRLHKDESPQEGLARKIKEELGLTIEASTPVHICSSYHGRSKTWQLIAGYICEVAGGDEIQPDATEVEEYKWVSVTELETLPMFDDCREIADVWLAQSSSHTNSAIPHLLSHV